MRVKGRIRGEWKGEGWAERKKGRGELIEYKGEEKGGGYVKGEFKKWKGGVKIKMNGKKGGIIRTALDDRKKFFCSSSDRSL